MRPVDHEQLEDLAQRFEELHVVASSSSSEERLVTKEMRSKATFLNWCQGPARKEVRAKGMAKGLSLAKSSSKARASVEAPRVFTDFSGRTVQVAMPETVDDQPRQRRPRPARPQSAREEAPEFLVRQERPSVLVLPPAAVSREPSVSPRSLVEPPVVKETPPAAAPELNLHGIGVASHPQRVSSFAAGPQESSESDPEPDVDLVLVEDSTPVLVPTSPAKSLPPVVSCVSPPEDPSPPQSPLAEVLQGHQLLRSPSAHTVSAASSEADVFSRFTERLEPRLAAKMPQKGRAFGPERPPKRSPGPPGTARRLKLHERLATGS